MKIISIGEVLWDIFANSEHLGGAPLNLAMHASRLGHEVLLLSAVGEDPRGRLALEKLHASGLRTGFIQRISEQPTGTAGVALDAAGEPRFAIQRPAAYDFLTLSAPELEALARECPAWICYGTLYQMGPQGTSVTDRVLASNPQARRFYDVNLREDCSSFPVIEHLLQAANVVKFNEQEARTIAAHFGWPAGSLEQFCQACARQFDLEGICVTLGPRGCSLLLGGDYAEADGFPVQVADPVGAGDAFAAALLHGIGLRLSARQIAGFANRLGAIVASRHGAVPEWTAADLAALGEGGA